LTLAWLTLSEDEMLCMVTDLPPSALTHPSTAYTEMGNAYLRAMAAKNISMQIRKF
jgi:hypothetical protein